MLYLFGAIIIIILAAYALFRLVR